MATPRRIGLIAGEASGDALGAGLIQHLRSALPDVDFVGVGGPRMQAEGFESLYDMDRLSVMGFTEPLKRLPELLRMRRALIRRFQQEPVDLFIGIDSPDFNLGIAKALHQSGILTAQYVSPSVWAWRQGRVRGIARSIDLMLTLFPFESRFYADHQVPVTFVGHPLASEIPQPLDREKARAELGLEQEGQMLALLPGSRSGEVEHLLPPFLATAERLRHRNPGLHFVIAAASPALRQKIASRVPADLAKVVEGDTRRVIAASDAVLAASGTTTLEIMLLGRPMVVAYRLGGVSYQIAKRLVKTPYVAIPNLLAQRLLVPEFIQDDAEPASLAESLQLLLSDPEHARLQTDTFAELASQLGGDSSRRAARAVVELLERRAP